MSLFDRIAFLICLLAIVASAMIADQVFERLPHLEDEITYTWQAKAIARGQLLVPSPPCPECFLVPFVVDVNGYRFGKYPLGFPVVLALGEILDIRWLINPILAGVCVWLTYRLVKKLLDEKTALLAAFLLAASPFFLMNAASLLAHPLSLFLALTFVLAWLDSLNQPAKIPVWLTVITAGISLGLLALTRPLTAVGVALPFFLHGILILFRATPEHRRRVIMIGLIVAGVAAIHFLWQAALTGDPLRNPYTLWWSYDTIGFGPGIGVRPEGNTLQSSLNETINSLWVGIHDLHGWAGFSWIFLPFGLFSLRCKRTALLVSMVLPSLIAVYLLYWIGASVLGPRYYYESIFCAVMLSAAGIRWLIGSLHPLPWRSWRQFRFPLGIVLVTCLTCISVFYYSPMRIGQLKGLYGISRSQQIPFLAYQEQDTKPTLFIVHVESHWSEYGGLLDLSNPFLDSPFIFSWSATPIADEALSASFPDRIVYHYYPLSRPGKFFPLPLPYPPE